MMDLVSVTLEQNPQSSTYVIYSQAYPNQKRGIDMQVNESIEDYLEQILIQQEKNGCARSVDIANNLGVTKASVSHATKLLRENDYILMADDKCITLTESGREIAERMYRRHRFLARFLMRLGVSEETAFADACKMEHDISAESFDAICRHADNIWED
jgi:Mn-dependent DtxR family transcriptional regulator